MLSILGKDYTVSDATFVDDTLSIKLQSGDQIILLNETNATISEDEFGESSFLSSIKINGKIIPTVNAQIKYTLESKELIDITAIRIAFTPEQDIYVDEHLSLNDVIIGNGIIPNWNEIKNVLEIDFYFDNTAAGDITKFSVEQSSENTMRLYFVNKAESVCSNEFLYGDETGIYPQEGADRSSTIIFNEGSIASIGNIFVIEKQGYTRLMKLASINEEEKLLTIIDSCSGTSEFVPFNADSGATFTRDGQMYTLSNIRARTLKLEDINNNVDEKSRIITLNDGQVHVDILTPRSATVKFVEAQNIDRDDDTTGVDTTTVNIQTVDGGAMRIAGIESTSIDNGELLYSDNDESGSLTGMTKWGTKIQQSVVEGADLAILDYNAFEASASMYLLIGKVDRDNLLAQIKPQLYPVDDYVVSEGETLVIELKAWNPNNLGFYYVIGSPDLSETFYEFDEKTGVFTWTPSSLDSGIYNIKASIDGYGRDSNKFTITVNDVDDTISCGQNIYKSIVLGNDIIDCEENGINVATDGITIDCNGKKISGQKDTGVYGIFLSDKSNTVIQNCRIAEFNYGIMIKSGSSNTVTQNSITDCDTGAFLDSTIENLFYLNTFTNTINAYETETANSNLWNLDIQGNLWSDITENEGYPIQYNIAGPGDGIDYSPTSIITETEMKSIESEAEITNKVLEEVYSEE